MENTSSSMLSRRLNFGFAFNDANFSDRVLNIEIMDDSFQSIDSDSDSNSNSEGSSSNNSESSTAAKVKTFHISSPILAANSPFFQKLFKNGMRESQQRDATLRISASEEAAVMDLLNFMYSNTLNAATATDVLGVLVVADKFEASDCVTYCCQLLEKMPMSLESALVYLELPLSVLMYEQVQPLKDAATKCLLAHFKDINKSQEEAMTLPLYVLEVLLGSGNLQAELSEDGVFDFILKWARAQYPELNRRHEIVTKCLVQFIRFHYMSIPKLKEVVHCPDLDPEVVLKLALNALFMLVEVPYRQNIDAYNECQVIKVEKYEPTQPRCVVYFDMTKDDCNNLFSSSSRHYSQPFRLGGRSFALFAQCNLKEQRHSFGLYLRMGKGSQSCSLGIEFAAAMKSSSMNFQFKKKSSDQVKYSLLSWGMPDLFNIPWTDFMSEDSEYFIDGILHLRADITIKDSEA